MPQSKKSVIISGATASGKSSLSLKLAQDFNGEIINADSLQIYKDLPILSAQPKELDQGNIYHHLYGFLNFDQRFSVFDWLKKVRISTLEIYKKNKLPIIVGGSGMYISKLVEGISLIPPISPKNKAQSLQDLDNYGLKEIIKKSQATNIIDKQRALRAYEIYLETGKPLSYWHQQDKSHILPDTQFIHFNINIDRSLIYDNCHKRFSEMLKYGAIAEAEALANKINNHGDINDATITKTLGYNEIINHLQKEISFDEMKNIICQKTRNYAKRQLTWFRNQLTIKTKNHSRFDIKHYDEILPILNLELKNNS